MGLDRFWTWIGDILFPDSFYLGIYNTLYNSITFLLTKGATIKKKLTTPFKLCIDVIHPSNKH